MRRAGIVILSVLAGCATSGPGSGPTPAANAGEAPPVWRSMATENDRTRLRQWRTAWVEALAEARANGFGDEVSAQGALLDPDAALPDASLPAGTYRCRTVKVGARGGGALAFVNYPFFRCQVEAAEGGLRFTKLSGSQRPIGRLYPDGSRRHVFLGTLQLGDEQRAFKYGYDSDRDMAGLLERIGARHWRLVLPYPRFESTLDVIELQPEE